MDAHMAAVWVHLKVLKRAVLKDEMTVDLSADQMDAIKVAL